jgi:transposase
MVAKKAYTEAFREETLALVQNSGKSKAALERELGLYEGQIGQWQKRRKGNGGMNGKSQDAEMEKTTETDLRAEVKRLTKENARLREEREILKKAIAIFTPGSE